MSRDDIYHILISEYLIYQSSVRFDRKPDFWYNPINVLRSRYPNAEMPRIPGRFRPEKADKGKAGNGIASRIWKGEAGLFVPAFVRSRDAAYPFLQGWAFII